MKTTMNFTTSQDDVQRFDSSEDLRSFYRHFGCDGLELMPFSYWDGKKELPPACCPLIAPGMIVGVHACCISDWMQKDHDFLLEHYRRDMDFARDMKAEYVVFHVTQVSDEEGFSYHPLHSDKEVILAACELINALLDGQDYPFYFLMENLWWPGLNFLDPAVTGLLLDNIHYAKKGLLLDTGHFLHTNLELKTQKEALTYLNTMLDRHQELLPYIKAIHLHQSLTGDYVKDWLAQPRSLPEDPMERFRQVYEHIFAIDQHLPFTAPGVRELVERIDPLYLTYEYITHNREELAHFLEAGSSVFTY